MPVKNFLLVLPILLAVSPAWAGADNTLFNPTPDDQMRPMTTERSSKADGPYSLDAGHFQIESNLYSYGRNNDCSGGNCTHTTQDFAGGTTTLRLGLTDHTDLQIISDLYHYIRTKDETTGAKDTRNGFGDTQVRLKMNFIGNNPNDKFSLGLIPFVKLPTNQNNLGNNDVEGGVELPFNVNFTDGWSLGGMTALNAVRNLNDDGYDPAYVNALVLGKSLTDTISAYGEFYTYKVDQSGSHWLNTADFGVSYNVTPNFKIDANTYIGVSDAADDMVWLFGGAYRF
jgi:hypothetical protein